MRPLSSSRRIARLTVLVERPVHSGEPPHARKTAAPGVGEVAEASQHQVVVLLDGREESVWIHKPAGSLGSRTDAAGDGGNLLWVKRRSAASPVHAPSDGSISSAVSPIRFMPPCDPSEGAVSPALGDLVGDWPARPMPVPQQLEQPVGSRSEVRLSGPARDVPLVAATTHMDARRHDDEAPVAADVDAGAQGVGAVFGSRDRRGRRRACGVRRLR